MKRPGVHSQTIMEEVRSPLFASNLLRASGVPSRIQSAEIGAGSRSTEAVASITIDLLRPMGFPRPTDRPIPPRGSIKTPETDVFSFEVLGLTPSAPLPSLGLCWMKSHLAGRQFSSIGHALSTLSDLHQPLPQNGQRLAYPGFCRLPRP